MEAKIEHTIQAGSLIPDNTNSAQLTEAIRNISAPLPQDGFFGEIGDFIFIHVVNDNVILPEGGSWVYLVFGFNSGAATFFSGHSGIEPGGANLSPDWPLDVYKTGFAWRIQ